MVHTHNMNTPNTQRPSVPGSRKAEGAKNPRVSKVQLNICTYNVRTLKDPKKEKELEQELIGVGFLVNKNIEDRVIEYEGESSRVTSLTLKVDSKYQLQVIQVYAPTSSHNDEEVEELYEEIGKSLEKNKSQYKIVMDDFNAKVGQHHQSDGATVGKFGLGERNERGTRLMQFAKSKGLKIGNTFYRKRKIRKWTWISPNGETRNENDYILVNKNMIQNVNVIKRVNIVSDHRMVRSKIKMNTRLERMKMMRPKGVKVNINALKQRENEFQLKLQNRFEALQEEDSAEEMALNITKTIKECAMETAGKEERRREEKLKQETKELLKERRAMAKKDLNDRERREYNKLCQTIRKRLREDLREHNTMQVKEAIESGKGLKRAKEKEGCKVLIPALIEQDGTAITNRERILESVEEKYINILKETYDGGTAQVRNESLSRKIKIMKGVRQGDTLSPVMFTAALEEIFRRMEVEEGININGEKMNNLRFADDIILFAENEEDLSKLLNELNKERRKDGMKMNRKKTKIMCNEIARKRRRKKIIVDGEQLEEVDDDKYLGRLLTPGNEMAKEIDERVTSAWKRFGQYSTFLRDQRMPMCLKRKIMNTVILPSMTYGAETWSLTNCQRQKLAVTQRSMKRSMLGVTRRDKIRNEDLRSRTGLKDVIEKVIEAKGKWAGHVARMKNHEWAKKTTEWTPWYRKREKGRPKRRWRDEIEQKAGSTWTQSAQNRDEWRKMWRPSASSGVTG
eukprot:gene8762-biopygen9749